MRQSDIAYTKIKEMIKTRQFKPGEALPEQQLCDLLNMSRTPVREALSRLQNDHAVISFPHSGSYVAQMDIFKLREVFVAREAAEGMIARLNCRDYLCVDEHRRLRDNFLWAASQDTDPEIDKFVDRTDFAMRDLLYRYCENKTLVRFCNELLSQITIHVHVTQAIKKFPIESIQEHVSILNAILQKDGDAAETATRRHLQRSFLRTFESLRAQGDYL